jgi:hypothetical protein
MVGIRSLVCGVALVVALAPMSALAADTSTEHLQAELANAIQLNRQSIEEAADIQRDGRLSGENERVIAMLESEAFRLRQLDHVANASAIEQITKALALSYRVGGELNARNELVIAQGRAAILVDKAEADMANAIAQNRPEEIANAKAQGMLMRAAASLISGVLAENNMSSSRIRGETQADIVHTPGLAEVANGQAMGANELLAADAALEAGDVGFTSADINSDEEATAVLEHGQAEVANAEARLAESSSAEE